jgi:Asp-tRNA(Asn)/Glu-tRNA(Gln) amidotransferase B subunit
MPNARVSAMDAALPGTLPVLSLAAVRAALRAGLALGATAADHTSFDRKHYHYPDLPHGYQITQHRGTPALPPNPQAHTHTHTHTHRKREAPAYICREWYAWYLWRGGGAHGPLSASVCA